MKKLLLLLVAATFGIAGTATAQKKSKKHHDDRNDKNYGKKYDRHDDDRDDRNWDYNNNNNNSNNAPRKVRDAFNRDYPNASNVNWTKDRGVWTANFKKSGLFGGRNSVSYRANGQRVGNNDRIARSDSRRNDNDYNRRNW